MLSSAPLVRGTAMPTSVAASAVPNNSSIRLTPRASNRGNRMTHTSPGEARRRAPGLLPTLLVGGRRRGGDGDERLEFQEALLADALDVHQLLDLLEAAVLLAVLEDSLGRGGADAGQRFELRLRGGVQVDGRGRRRGGLRRLGLPLRGLLR